MPDDLFSWADGVPRSRNTDPHTSHAAAERVGEFSHVHFGLILAALRSRPGTIYEIGRRAGLSHVQVARRMPELEGLGRVAANGTALGPTGRACRVWQLTVAQ
jgi:hypothetical protein